MRNFTFEVSLAREKITDTKSEYYRGQVIAMGNEPSRDLVTLRVPSSALSNCKESQRLKQSRLPWRVRLVEEAY